MVQYSKDPFMTIRRLAAWPTLGLAFLLAACGGGSGRYTGSDLVVSGVGPSAPLNGGDTVTFVMTVRNASDFDVTNASIHNVTTQLSTPTLSITCAAAGGAACPTQLGTSMTVSALPKGGVLTFTVVGTLITGANGQISDTMTVTSDNVDPNTDNNTATASVTSTSNDVSVTATAPPGPLLSGSAVYTMVVTNAGPDTAVNASLATTVSSDLTLVPAAISCIPTAGAVAPTLQADGTLLVPSIPVNGVLTCSVPVTVMPATNGLAVVTMTASSVGDGKTANNSATASVSATLVSDLSVVGTPPIGPLLTPNTAFTMTVSNLGPADATAVVLTNTLGPNLALARPIACAASGGAVAPTLQADGTLLAPSIPFNGVLTCNVPVTVAAGNTGTAFDTLTVSSCCDLRAANNSATAAVSTTLSNNLNVVANPAAPLVAGGGSTVFSFAVGNTGPSTAFNVALTNALSPNLSLAGGIACTASGAAVTPVVVAGILTSAAIPAGDSLTCNVPVTVTAGANGNVYSTFTVSAANDQRSIDNAATAVTTAVSSDLGVSASAATQVAAGSAVTLNAFVVNPRGQGPATDVVVTWAMTGPSGTTFAAPTCTASGGAVCPSGIGPNSISVPSLIPGGQLQLSFVASTASSSRGNIVNTVSVSSEGDPNAANNSATATTAVVDGRSGSYLVFGADGQPNASLAISFSDDGSSGQYTMTSGANVSASFPFTLDASTGDYVVSGSARFRIAQDLLAGGHDFGNGVLPYLAVRSFATTLAGAAGSYNLATRNLASGGATTTHGGTAVLSGNTLSICQSDLAVVASVNNCAAADRKDYFVTATGSGAFTAVLGAESYTFSVANSGAAKVLLSTGSAVDQSLQFRVGLQDSSLGVISSNVRGASTRADFLAIALNNPGVAAGTVDYMTPLDSAALVRIPNSTFTGPFSMLTGSRAADSARIYVMQAVPLVVALGDFASPASGFLQIGLP